MPTVPKSIVIFIAFLVVALWVYFNWEDSGIDSKIPETKNFLHSLTDPLERLRKDTGQYPEPKVGLNLLKAPLTIEKDAKDEKLEKKWRGPYVDLKRPFTDPWDMPIKYSLDGEHYILRSAGPDKTFGSEDDITLKK